MNDLTAIDWAGLPVRIEGHTIYFGETKLPGCVLKDGVTFRPGSKNEFNTLTVQFIVGPLTADDPTEDAK